MDTPSLTPYEQRQLERLREWQAQPPGWLTRRFAQAAGPASHLAQRLVPVSALKFALNGATTLAARLTSTEVVLRDAGVAALAELQTAELSRCDALAERIRRQAVGLSAAGGALAGVAGAPGLVLDVPALLTLSLHTIQRTGLCYGYDSLDQTEQPYAIGVFALASANTLEEKRVALEALRRSDEPDESAFRDGLERAAQRELSKSAAVFSLQNLARQLGLNLTRRKTASAVPLLGAVVGGAVNAWYLHDLAQTARYAFHARRFAQQGFL
ncbi:MAG: EcsC family protein [Nevskiales bacterium]